MIEAKKTASKKKPVARKTSVAKKKTTARKKTVRKKTIRKKTASSLTRAAATSRHALTEKLNEDLKASRVSLEHAKIAVSEELNLAKNAAQDEIAVLKVKLNAALKREKKLMQISEKKIKQILVAGGHWEKKQLISIKKATEKAIRRMNKK